MKTTLRSGLVALGLALLLSACSSDEPSEAIVGTWEGTAAGITITAEVADTYEQSGTFSLLGTVETDSDECFRTAQLAGQLTGDTIELVASGSGAASQSTVIQITGTFDGSAIEGLFSMTSSNSDCHIDPAIDITLE